MKRWVVVLLVLLAVVLLVSPGIVGQLAERSLKDSLSWAERESADFRVTEEAFDRGWFTAVGRHRIELKHGDLRSSLLKFSGLETSDQVPALIVDTRIDHGLVPFTSMSRQSGSLVPALASTVSTMQLDTGDGEAIHIPGTLYTQVGLTGATASRYLLEPGSFDENDAEATWQGADVSASTDSLRKELSYEGTVEPLSLSTGDSNLGLKQAAFQGNSRYTDFGFMVGAISVDIDEFAYKDGANQAVNIRNLAFNAKSDVADGRVSGKTNVTVNGFSGLMQADQILRGTALIGRDVLVPSDTLALDEDGGAGGIVAAPGPGTVAFEITDANGNVVRQVSATAAAAGEVALDWDGMHASGERLPPGNYTVNARHTGPDGEHTDLATYVRSRVQSVSVGSEGLYLDLQGIGTAPISYVLRVI